MEFVVGRLQRPKRIVVHHVENHLLPILRYERKSWTIPTYVELKIDFSRGKFGFSFISVQFLFR